ncbi:MAG TPA: biotin transporter BioY [Chlamydiales bacterium]|nr:biotin transporter BioY [Chlamydiales bacterium]
MNSAVFPKLDAKEIIVPIIGCSLLLIGASIRIPFYPVPLTLHTFALFLIALTQSPKQALYSVSGYLFLLTLGIQGNPFWWMSKCGGYLWAFPIAAYGMAAMRSKIGNFLKLALGSGFILLCGFVWLIPFVGLAVAWKYGLVVFIPSELAKIIVVLSLKRRFL